MIEANEIVTQNKDWITLVFFLILIALVLVKVLFNDRLWNTNGYFLSKKNLSINFNKEPNSIFNLFQSLMFFVKLLSVSLLIYYTSAYLNLFAGNYNFNTFLFILAGTTLYFVFMFGVGLAIATILNLEKVYTKILYQRASYFNNLVLWLLPMLAVLAYFPSHHTSMLKITLIFMSFLLVVRYVLLVINNKKLIFSNLFYFILYLCALEIAPLVIILKLTI